MKLTQPIAYTDGASLGNPGPGGWGAVVLFPGTDATGAASVVEYGGAADKTTNNRMELQAVIAVVAQVRTGVGQFDTLVVQSDSRYTISGITSWVHNWMKQGWRTKAGTPVQNKELWQSLYSEVQQFPGSIDWQYVPGHSGVPGNERADAIATGFAKKEPPHLYTGAYDVYPHGDLLRATPTQKNQFYISCVDGIVETHTTWSDCEKRVRGVAGAQFRKVYSNEEAQRFIQEWGCVKR